MRMVDPYQNFQRKIARKFENNRNELTKTNRMKSTHKNMAEMELVYGKICTRTQGLV